MCFRVAALFLLSFAISSECVQIEGAENVRDYLNRRHEETKVEIAKAYMAGGNADSGKFSLIRICITDGGRSRFFF